MTWVSDISRVHLRVYPLISLQHSPDAKTLLLDLQDSHFAILLPDRGDLAATYLALRVWNAVRWIADHLVTESLYL